MSEDLVAEVESVFSQNGPLVDAIDGYRLREPQRNLAVSMATAISNQKNLVSEAATGTGKTFAYLVPALLSDQRTIISTGTKHLQDQLFFGDLPQVMRALGQSGKVAYLKGRANYLCHYRIDLYSSQGHFSSPEIAKQLTDIRKKLSTVHRGDINELPDIEDDSPVWPYATSTPENCVGSECAFFNDCFVQKARRKALEASVLVINHHLFFADSILKEDGFAEILPSAKLVVFDEAHQLVDVASNFFGDRISTRKLNGLCEDIDKECTTHARDMAEIKEKTDGLRSALQQLSDALPDEGKHTWVSLIKNREVEPCFETLLKVCTELSDLLLVGRERSKGLDSCFERISAVVVVLENFMGHAKPGNLLWAITYPKSFVLFCSPIDVGVQFQSILHPNNTTYLFTSATLSVSGSLSHFKQQLGISDCEQCLIDSPFEVDKNALLYLPRQLPDVKSSEFIASLIKAILPPLQRLNGRTLMLFTSYRALNLAKDYLLLHHDFKLLVQGEKSKSALLADFKASAQQTILLATSSFWEGVDIKGPALSMVVIDKLPFESPGEPLVQAKLDSIAKNGGNPFAEHQIPKAIIALKQGVGRLLRDEADTGIVVIGDGRLYGRSYGADFLRSLPPMPVTRDRQSVLEFINENCTDVL